ncbi:MAG TPA: hypothetical protein VKL40_00555 [Candidatus Angelobacter sp.]|nr:hypothetical protein [Candidatus Angelobacter sp.]
MPPRPVNLLVFRETRERVRGLHLKSALLRVLADFPARPSSERVMAALLRAGELECAAADVDDAAAQTFSQMTDRLAEALLQPESGIDCCALTRNLTEAPVPHEVWVSPPEGFAYYALHPLAYAEAFEQIPTNADGVLVVGIRSIGTTLSAVTAAAARKHGLRAQRITVRPGGHPYNRRTQFSLEQLDLIRRSSARGAAFLVVDEGPGLSGSSFLSVAEALKEAGAPRDKITLICGHQPDFDSLRADDGPRRARRFRWVAAASEPHRPTQANVFIGGGEWRRRLFVDQRAWPASWTTLERLKYLSSDQGAHARLFNFLGFGHYGQQVLQRQEKIAAAGFGPAPCRESEGFASYCWLRGRPMSAEDLSPNVLQSLAEYCAFRSKVLAADVADLSPLEQMTEHNLRELRIDQPVALKIEHPTICDGRMQPHEWLLTEDGRMLKTDSGSHGDDHFFPGPTDIAWDLAGVIVEWRMNPAQREFFLEAYRRASGDDAQFRVADFSIAYALFRLAYCRMAANALPGTDEEARLILAAAKYGQAMEELGPLTVPQLDDPGRNLLYFH